MMFAFFNRKRAVCFAMLIGCAPLLLATAAPQNKVTGTTVANEKKQFRATLYRGLAWLPEGKGLDAAQEAVFEILQQKGKGEAKLPTELPDDVMAWQFWRYYPKGEADVENQTPSEKLSAAQRQHLYFLVHEDLLMARQLLRDQNSDRQRLGLQLANAVTLKLAVVINDKSLDIKVSEAFVLPYLGVAVVDPSKGLSRTQLLQAACISYMVAGDAKLADALKALIVVANQANSPGEANWARAKLGAVTLAQGGDIAEAIAQLKAIPDDSSLRPLKEKLLPQLEKKLSGQKEK